MLLLYVAFSVVFNICFDVQPDTYTFLYVFDVAIDWYFACDIVLNLHTAHYDASGSLVGIRKAPDRYVSPKADTAAMYTKYAKGWLVIDVLSILPVGLIGNATGVQGADDTGAQLRALKTLRLFRLVKLLKLVRGMRLFKK